jgi:hypothetical protein
MAIRSKMNNNCSNIQINLNFSKAYNISQNYQTLTTTEIYLNLSPEDVVKEFNEKW